MLPNQLVVARYREHLNWLYNLPDTVEVIVYNKFHVQEGQPLPNIGRESHTYLHHILNNWDNLPPIIGFVQGHPYDHTSYLVKKLVHLPANLHFEFLSDRILMERGSGGPYAWGINFDKWYKLAFCTSEGIGHYIFGAGAQFVVSRDAVLHRPREFYEHLFRIISDPKCTEEFGHALERFWFYIFNSNHSRPPQLTETW